MAYELRDTYKYYLKRGNRIVYAGVTEDLERREQEHRRNRPGVRIVQVGRRTTRTAALVWERLQAEKGIPIGR